MAGLVPPFSPFHLEILRYYQIHLLHLHPASIAILATFTFFCEAFLGVRPSMAFFRHFYSLRMTASGVTGSVSFRLNEHEAAQLISMAVTKRLEDFHRSCVFVDTGLPNEVLLELPTEQLAKLDRKSVV